MKKFAIVGSVLIAGFGWTSLLVSRSLSGTGFQFSLNWLTVIPAVAALSVFVAYLVRKELKAIEVKTRNAQAAGTFTGKPVAHQFSVISTAR